MTSLPSSLLSSPSSESGSPVKRSLLALPIALLALSACGPTPESADPSSVADRVLESTTVAEPAVVPSKVDPYIPVDSTDMILQSVAAGEGIDMPDGMASEYADIICEGLDDGLSPWALVRIGVTELPMWDAGQHAFLVGASVGAACPEYADLIEAVS